MDTELDIQASIALDYSESKGFISGSWIDEDGIEQQGSYEISIEEEDWILVDTITNETFKISDTEIIASLWWVPVLILVARGGKVASKLNKVKIDKALKMIPKNTAVMNDKPLKKLLEIFMRLKEIMCQRGHQFLTLMFIKIKTQVDYGFLKIKVKKEKFLLMNLISKMEGIMSATNLYCTLTFYSDSEKFEMNDFQNKLKVSQKRSWTMGDLQRPDYEESKRMDSSADLMSDVSEDNNGTNMISNFFKYLTSKKEEILFLKEKYKTNMYFDIVTNLESCDSPIITLNQDQLLLLVEIDAELNCSVYDYK